MPEHKREYVTTIGRYAEVKMLVEAGVSLHDIPGKVGVSRAGLEKWLYRHGHNTEANLFGRVEAGKYRPSRAKVKSN
jgi:hypothetical protein